MKDVLEAIHHRQSVSKVKADPVPDELIEQLLDAAVQAPNHHRVRPWRFTVIRGAARQHLGELMAASLRQRKPETPQEGLIAEGVKALRSPVIIAVGVDKPAEAKVDEIENICAAAAATQNLLLAAEGLGLAARWRTGPAAKDPAIKAFLGLQPDQHLISFVYLGYPEADRPAPERPGFADRTTWLE